MRRIGRAAFTGRRAVWCGPASTDEVAGVLRVCSAGAAAVVPQGGNTGLVGGGVPRGGEVVVSLRRLHAIGSGRRAAWSGRGRGGRGPRRGARRCPWRGLGCRSRHGFARYGHDRRDGEHQRGRRARVALRIDAQSGAGPRGGPGRRDSGGAHSRACARTTRATTSPACSRARRARWRSSPEYISRWSPTCPIESSRCAPSTVSPTR